MSALFPSKASVATIPSLHSTQVCLPSLLSAMFLQLMSLWGVQRGIRIHSLLTSTRHAISLKLLRRPLRCHSFLATVSFRTLARQKDSLTLASSVVSLSQNRFIISRACLPRRRSGMNSWMEPVLAFGQPLKTCPAPASTRPFPPVPVLVVIYQS